MIGWMGEAGAAGERPSAGRRRPRALVALAATALAAFLLVGGGNAKGRAPAAVAALFPPPFHQIGSGPRGGTVWQGFVGSGSGRTLTLVYLPPRFSTARRYPVVYLLHGMPGSPYSYIGGRHGGLHLPQFADGEISAGRMAPFIAVIPRGGPTHGRYDGEWAGPWEDALVRTVVPWVDAHLPTIAAPSGRIVAGLSAGGYGAVDIALRHPGLFGAVESWSGYFVPFRDGPLTGASASLLAQHDPALLARLRADALRRFGMRFYLSDAGGHGAVPASATPDFARELGGLRVAAQLRVFHHGTRHTWVTQFRDGLIWAFGRPAAGRVGAL